MIVYLGNQLCGRCLNLEEDPNDIKEDSDRLMKDISRLESMHSKEKEEWKGTMVEVIKEKDMNISILENKNDKLLVEIGELQRKIEEIETQKETVLKEHKKMEEQIENLGTMNEELKSEKCELSTQMIMLTKTASNSLKECQKLKEELKNLNFRNRKYVGTMIMSLSVLNMFILTLSLTP